MEAQGPTNEALMERLVNLEDKCAQYEKQVQQLTQKAQSLFEAHKECHSGWERKSHLSELLTMREH